MKHGLLAFTLIYTAALLYVWVGAWVLIAAAVAVLVWGFLAMDGVS